MHYEELVRNHAPVWPYPVNYAKENLVICDVLIIGGGIAGCWAAISAARRGVRVAIVEKAATITSGAGGAGVDHWHALCTAPCCKVTPEEFAQVILDSSEGRWNGITTYIKARESYDCLLELEKMGVKIRDSDDEFKGAEFRDENTKLLFAYDYINKHTARVWGSNAKQALYRECKRLGINIFDRTMVTSLLTKDGKQGAPVVGATGFNIRNGEYYIFKGKATVLCIAPGKSWSFSTEMSGFSSLMPDGIADHGHAIAWRAGAEFTGLTATGPVMGGSGYPFGGIGSNSESWYACSIVDSNGKEIPWVDRDGKLLKSVSERYRPAPGQKFFLCGGRAGSPEGKPKYDFRSPSPIPDWRDRVRTGEYTLPIYADLPSMPDIERKVIFRLMVPQQGKGLIPIYRTYTDAGFDPDKDMLQYYESDIDGVRTSKRLQVPEFAGLVIDWDLKTNLDGLYAAGSSVFSAGAHAHAATTGRYAGRKAAEYAKGVGELVFDRKQVDVEKTRIYAPLQRKAGIDWKELGFGVNKVLQDYCVGGRIENMENQELLKIGLRWLDELEAGEASMSFARNPHELSRLLDVFSKISFGKAIVEAYLLPQARDSWTIFKQDEGRTIAGKLPFNYFGDLRENYEAHSGLQR